MDRKKAVAPEKSGCEASHIGQLKDMIVATNLRLPEQQERVARIALFDPDVVAFGTTASLAQRCMVAPSTVVCVANALGFATFKEFRHIFRQHLLAKGKVA
ncbi:MurR/RpiR family transcriptional regulator [Rhizobium jaguaris]|uniref:MurR/RpiR family transcriptional regulator n=1 Tax=Rhizobium jaguaris TaxID=1312183 RepID=A0A387G8G7_9HYPH|nr:MurR/RpiR family transcriptional regulator [Rhizobium jaguaris]AYG64454.1 MurR/RpiR family transcriptional regulator [Rhizobium jaguaris]